MRELKHRTERRAPHREGAAAWFALGLIGLVALLWLIWNGEAVRSFKEEAGPVPYFLAMSVLPALGFPLTPFFVLAGATFGTAVGLLGSSFALVLNLMLCYWIATSGLRPRIASIVERRHGHRLPDFQARRSGIMRFVLLVKLTPGLPGFAKNYMLGLAGVPFWTYLLASLAFTGAYALALVWIGDSLAEHDVRQSVLGALGLALLALVLWSWKRRKQRPAAEQLA